MHYTKKVVARSLQGRRVYVKEYKQLYTIKM